MKRDQLIRIARVFQRLGNPGVRTWEVADYLARHDPEGIRYSGPLKQFWHGQVMAALSERSQPIGDFFRFVHCGGGVYKVSGTIPEEAPEEPAPLGQPRLIFAPHR